MIYRDQLRPAAELDADGKLKSVFVYAARSNVPEFMDRGGITYKFVTDHLGSVRMVVNASTKQIMQSLSYDVWGKVLTDSNPGFQPFGFAGGLYDHETGFVQFGARDYDGSIGRWLDKDAIRFAGRMNFYIYCGDDPINLIDSDGFEARSADPSAHNLYNNLKNTMLGNPKLSEILKKINSKNSVNIVLLKIANEILQMPMQCAKVEALIKQYT